MSFIRPTHTVKAEELLKGQVIRIRWSEFGIFRMVLLEKGLINFTANFIYNEKENDYDMELTI